MRTYPLHLHSLSAPSIAHFTYAYAVKSYTEYRKKREKEHEAWVQRQKERAEKLARGEEVGPEEPDPTEEPEVGLLGLLKFILYCAVFIILAGKFFTGSFLWEQELPNLSRFLSVSRIIPPSLVFHIHILSAC